MRDDEALSRLLNTLYAAPIQPEIWNSFLVELAGFNGVSQAALIEHHVPENRHLIFAGVGYPLKEGAPVYERLYWRFDEWTLRFPKQLGRMPVNVFLGEQIWPENELLRSTYYNEFLKKFEVCQIACATVASAPGVFDVLSVYRGHGEAPFDREQIAILETLAPHLQVAFATRKRLLGLEARVAGLENALNQLQSAVILLDATERVVFVNQAARSILTDGDGLVLSRLKLSAQGITQRCKLRSLISLAIGIGNERTRCGGAMPIPRLGKKPLHLLVSPLRSRVTEFSGSAAVAIFLDDPERDLPVPAEILRVLFGLTAAEAKLAVALLNGQSIAAVANLHQVSKETIRTQMKSIFQKTGTKRQSDLIRLLAGSCNVLSVE